MLVSAAMAERPRATASSRSRPAPAVQAPDQRRLSTARVSTTQGAHAAAAGARRSELPGWFWGALGCLTVLVVGLSVVFFIGQTSPAPSPAPASASPAASAPAAAAAVAPAAAPSAPAAARAGTPGMHIEQMAPPPPAIDQVPDVPAAPVAKQKAAAHPMKIARSPAAGARPAGGARPAAGASPAVAASPAAEKDDDAPEELPKVKAPASGRPSPEDEANDR